MLLNVQQRGMHCLLRVCFCRVALSSVSLEVFLAVTAIAVTAVDNLRVLGCFLNDTEVRFACKANLPVLNDYAFICQSGKAFLLLRSEKRPSIMGSGSILVCTSKQECRLEIQCYRGFAMLPSPYWYTAKGVSAWKAVI